MVLLGLGPAIPEAVEVIPSILEKHAEMEVSERWGNLAKYFHLG